MRRKNNLKKRRISILTAIIIAIIATIGWMRFQQSLRHWYYLININLWPHPIYLAVTGGLIGMGYSFALVFHFSRKSFTTRYLRILGILLITWLWIDRIFIGMRDAFSQLLASTILITILLILFDILIFQKITYQRKEKNDGSKN